MMLFQIHWRLEKRFGWAMGCIFDGQTAPDSAAGKMGTAVYFFFFWLSVRFFEVKWPRKQNLFAFPPNNCQNSRKAYARHEKNAGIMAMLTLCAGSVWAELRSPRQLFPRSIRKNALNWQPKRMGRVRQWRVWKNLSVTPSPKALSLSPIGERRHSITLYGANYDDNGSLLVIRVHGNNNSGKSNIRENYSEVKQVEKSVTYQDDGKYKGGTP